MPMFFFCRNVYDISHTDDLLARFYGDDALAGSDKQHLIAAMGVHFVARTGAEVDDTKVEVVIHLRCQQRLSRYWTTGDNGLFADSAGISSGLSTFILPPVSSSSRPSRY